MNIAAFDLSLTATGFAFSGGVTGLRLYGQPSGVITPKDLRGMDRLQLIRRRVLEMSSNADVVVLEGLAFGAKGNAMLDLAGLAAVIRLALTDREQPYVDIPPSSLKLFATGKGNAPKDEVLAAAIRRLGYAGHDHNEADALWLLEIARAWYDADSFAQQPSWGIEAKTRAMSKIKWPEPAACR